MILAHQLSSSLSCSIPLPSPKFLIAFVPEATDFISISLPFSFSYPPPVSDSTLERLCGCDAISLAFDDGLEGDLDATAALLVDGHSLSHDILSLALVGNEEDDAGIGPLDGFGALLDKKSNQEISLGSP